MKYPAIIFLLFLFSCAGKSVYAGNSYASLTHEIKCGLPAAALQFDIADSSLTRNKKIAAILAFPLPFGIIGLHRIYLGAHPLVPVFYVLTLGGGFGILHLIDFVVLILSDHIDRYIDNPRIFMWD